MHQFERDCLLMGINFEYRPDPQDRRAIRKVTSWEKVYLVEFYWGRPTFVSKRADFLGEPLEEVPNGSVRCYPDTVIFEGVTNSRQIKKLRTKAHSRWTKQQHLMWLEREELFVRQYWAREKYSAMEDSPDLVDAMAAFAVLGLPPFALTAQVKKAFRQLALRFHPDYGGDESAFRFLREQYKLALLYADDYLLVSTSEAF